MELTDADLKQIRARTMARVRATTAFWQLLHLIIFIAFIALGIGSAVALVQLVAWLWN